MVMGKCGSVQSGSSHQDLVIRMSSQKIEVDEDIERCRGSIAIYHA
jgi:hypothetical protein